MKLTKKKKSNFADRLAQVKTRLTLDDKIYFGQFKGSTLEEIGQMDSRYLKWLIDCDVIRVTEQTKEMVSLLSTDSSRPSAVEDEDWELLFDRRDK